MEKSKNKNFIYPQLIGFKPIEWLCKYRKINVYLVWLFYLPVIIIALIYSLIFVKYAYGFIFLIFLSGIFTWTLVEYFLHRFVLHFVSETSIIKKVHNFIHGAHHVVPKDLQFFTASPFVTFPIALIFWFLFYQIFGNQLVWSFYAGFGLGYLLYEYVHYAIHKYPQPPYPFLKKLWINHLKHHYKCPDKRFGVTNTFWDYVFMSNEHTKK